MYGAIVRPTGFHEKKPGLTEVRPGPKVILRLPARLEDELQRVLNLPVAALARELRFSEAAGVTARYRIVAYEAATGKGHTRGRGVMAIIPRGIHSFSPGYVER